MNIVHLRIFNRKDDDENSDNHRTRSAVMKGELYFFKLMCWFNTYCIRGSL